MTRTEALTRLKELNRRLDSTAAVIAAATARQDQIVAQRRDLIFWLEQHKHSRSSGDDA